MRIHTGGLAAYRALRMGENYVPLDKSFDDYNKMLVDTISADNTHLKQMYTDAFETFDRLENHDYNALYKQMMRKSVGADGANSVVRPLRTVEEFQDAIGLTRQLLMACPEVRARERKQTIEGYAGVYTDPFKDTPDLLHPDYLRVMNGVAITTPATEDEEETCYATTYFFDDHGMDLPELELQDQVQTLENWEILKMLLQENGLDPTSPEGIPLN